MPEGDTIDANVIVAGADLDALVCAAHLAMAGLGVTVIAAHPIIGGAAGTRAIMGEHVGVASPDVPLSISSRTCEELRLTDYGLDLIANSPSLVAIPWDDDRPFIQFTEVDRTLDMLGVLDAASLDGYRRYLDDALPLAEFLGELTFAGARPHHALMRMSTAAAARGRALRTWEQGAATEILHHYFGSEVLQAAGLMLAQAPEHVDPTAPGTGRLALSLALRHADGSCRVLGGQGAMVAALVQCIEDHGGAVWTGVDASMVRTSDAKVAAVELADGDVLTAGAVVVSGDPGVLVHEWLDDPDALGRQILQRYKQPTPKRPAYSHIDAVLTEEPRYLALAETPFLNAAHVATATVAVVPTVEELLEAGDIRRSGKVPNRPGMLASTPSLVDPTLLASEGRHLFSLDVLDTPYELEGGWVDSDEPRRWLDAFATVIAPGLTTTIEEWGLLTPVELERDIGLAGGATVAYSGSGVDAMLGRQRELTRYRFPIAGLYLTGPATFPGPSHPGAAGRSTAAVVLSDLGR